MKAADNQIGAMAQTRKSVIGHASNLFSIHRRSVFHPCLDVAVTKFFWIDLRRTRWQPFDMNRWVFSQARPHLLAPMNRRSVPYQYEWLSNISSQMVERFDNGFTIERLVEMALIDSARDRQSYGSRKDTAIISDSSQQGWFPARSPGVSNRFKKPETDFIKKHDFSTDAPRFFLYAATRGEATLPPIPHPVRRIEEQVFAVSSPVFVRSD